MAKMGRPKSEKAKEKRVTLRLTDEEFNRLTEYAIKHSMTKSEVLKRALDVIK